MPAIYDDQKQKKSGAEYDNLGVHPERREAEVDSLKKLYNKESRDDKDRNTSTKAESLEQSQLSSSTDEPAGWDTNVAPKNSKIFGMFDRKKSLVGGGIGGAIIGLLFGIFGISLGPAAPIHLAQLLQDFHFSDNEDAGRSRVMQLVRYARNNQHKSNLGVVGNVFADKFEARLIKAGMKPIYTTPDGRGTRSIQAFEIDPNTAQGRKVLTELQLRGIDDIPLGPGKIQIDLRGSGSTARARDILRAANNATGTNKAMTAIAQRVAFKRAGISLNPLKNKLRETGENVADYRKRVREDMEEANRTGVDVDKKSRVDTEDGGDADDGSSTDSRSQDAASRAQAEANELVRGDTPAEISANLKRSVQTAGIGLGTVTLMCGFYQFGEAIPDLRQANVVLPLARQGMQAVAVGNQVMSGKNVNADELGAFMENFYDTEKKLSALSARSIKAEQGEPLTGPDIPDAAKPNTKKPAFFNVIDNIVEGTGLRGACGFVTSTVGGFVVDAADIGLSVATGGAYAGLRAGGGAALGTIGGYAAEPFFNDLAQWIAGEPIKKLASGPEWGNYVNYGVRLAANDAAISMGGKALSLADQLGLEKNHQREKVIAQKMKNPFDRYLNPYDVDSATSQIAIKNPELTSIPSSAASIISTPQKLLGSILPKSHRAIAQEQYDYGFPQYGFSTSELYNEAVEDPFLNAEIVEPKLDELNEKYGDCFGTTIDNEGKVVSGEAARYDQIDENPACNDEGTDYLRYRMYIMDTITLHSMTCLDGENDSCDKLGITGSTSSASGSTAPGGGSLGIDPSGFVFPLKTTKGTINSSQLGWSKKNDHGTMWGGTIQYYAYDIGAPQGVDVVAVKAGTIRRVKADTKQYSLHLEGDDGKWYYYQHMDPAAVLGREGQKVTAGQVIGKIGPNAINASSGANTAPHLHFSASSEQLKSSSRGCSRSSCPNADKLIDVLSVLVSSFERLPE